MQRAISHPTALQVQGNWVSKVNGHYLKHETTKYGEGADVIVVTFLGPRAADQTSSSYLGI